MDDANADKAIQALRDFGFGSIGILKSDLLDPENIIQLGYPPNRIDILTSLEDLDFNRCFDRRNAVDIEGIEVNFIDLENLIVNKKQSGRLQDLADAEALENILKKKGTK